MSLASELVSLGVECWDFFFSGKVVAKVGMRGRLSAAHKEIVSGAITEQKFGKADMLVGVHVSHL